MDVSFDVDGETKKKEQKEEEEDPEKQGSEVGSWMIFEGREFNDIMN